MENLLAAGVALWQRATEPHPALTDYGEHERVRAIASIYLLLAMISTLTGVIYAIAGRMVISIVALVFLPILVIMLVLVRGRHLRSLMPVAIALHIAGIAFVLARTMDNDAALGLLIPYILISLMYPTGAAILSGTAMIAAIIGFGFWLGNPMSFALYATFLVLAFTLIQAVIASQQRAIRALGETTRLYTSLINSANQSFLVIGRDYRIRLANPVAGQRMAQIFGKRPYPGDNMMTFVLPEDKEDFIRDTEAAFQGRAITITKTFTTIPGGPPITLNVQYFPVTNPDGCIEYACMYVEDVSELVEREHALRRLNDSLEARVKLRTAELENANERLKELSATKDDFIANTSHELRTPLANLKLYLSLLERNPVKTEHYMEVLKRESLRLNTLVEDLLTISRLDREGAAPNLHPLDLTDALNQITADRTLLAKRKGQSIVFRPTGQPLLVQADRAMLEQVIGILLTNAINYAPNSSIIMLRIEDAAPGEMVSFSVENECAPLSDMDMHNLFERFYRGKNGVDSGAPGTGLGLAIAKQIVESHGGGIQAVQLHDPNRLCITIRLPREA